MVTFSSLIEALDLSNVEVTSSCLGAPPLAISMSDNGAGKSIATLDFLAGTCSSGNWVSFEIRVSDIVDQAGNRDLLAPNYPQTPYVIP